MSFFRFLNISGLGTAMFSFAFGRLGLGCLKSKPCLSSVRKRTSHLCPVVRTSLLIAVVPARGLLALTLGCIPRGCGCLLLPGTCFPCFIGRTICGRPLPSPGLRTRCSANTMMSLAASLKRQVTRTGGCPSHSWRWVLASPGLRRGAQHLGGLRTGGELGGSSADACRASATWP